jgi:heparinase II/III-like protein
MSVARWAALARKAVRRPPRYVLWRLGQEVRRQARRPWSRVRPRLLTDHALVRLAGGASLDDVWEAVAREPFFVAPAAREEGSRRFLDTFPSAKREILEAAEAVLAHELDLLGSGRVRLGSSLPWHDDFKTGRRWPLRYACDIDYNELDRPSDVKVPWELSRCQHFTLLGQAYWLTGDERFAREYVAEVLDWTERNPWGYGVNWACTMDVALRAISWLWGFYYLAGSAACRSPRFRSTLLRSLYLHGEFVAANLERSDVNGNHYLTDAVGLVFLGCAFRRTRAGRRWLALGQAIVFAEIESQVTDDGVDFEMSTAYHRLVLEAFLSAVLLLRLAGEAIPPPVWTRLGRMHEFVAAYTKPDGSAPLIGDADDGRIQKLGVQAIGDHRYLLSTGAVLFGRGDFKQAAGRFWEESFWLLGPDAVEAYAALAPSDAPPASTAFPAGGFYVMRGPRAHLIVDCGEVGLRGRGGHGHNDILSFELFLGGMNVVTDCGAYAYTGSRQWRNRFRGTAFHNTLQVDGEELNRFVDDDELWRLRYDAVPGDVTWRPGPGADYFRGSHRGYARLREPVAHTREILLHRMAGRVAIRDTVVGAGGHRLVWRFHLDPALTASVEGDGVRLTRGPLAVWFWPIARPGASALRIEDGWVSPSYGVKLATSVIVIDTTTAVPASALYLFADASLHADERARWTVFPGDAA